MEPPFDARKFVALLMQGADDRRLTDQLKKLSNEQLMQVIDELKAQEKKRGDG